jgi:hypothetical protein
MIMFKLYITLHKWLKSQSEVQFELYAETYEIQLQHNNTLR